MCCTYHRLNFSSPNRSKKQKNTRATEKRLPFGKWRFREKEVRRMGQKQKMNSDRGETSKIHGLPSGFFITQYANSHKHSVQMNITSIYIPRELPCLPMSLSSLSTCTTLPLLHIFINMLLVLIYIYSIHPTTRAATFYLHGFNLT